MSFIFPHPDWFRDVYTNIIPVLKKDGKARVCVDYWDLNRASPKNEFPLPYINVLVDDAA